MKHLSEQDYRQLLATGEVVAFDGWGEKVLHFNAGSYLKLFRTKRLISTALIFPYWIKFVRNAARLPKLGIPTVDVVEVMKVPHIKKHGVFYRPLEGVTFRGLVADGQFSRERVEELGVFMAELNRKGVHFRSFHLGNVVQCPEGKIGLIDVSDMKIFPWPLAVFTRQRNFIHLFRYEQDLSALLAVGENTFIKSHIHALSLRLARRMNKRLYRLIGVS